MRRQRLAMTVLAVLATASVQAETGLAMLRTNPFLQPDDLDAGRASPSKQDNAADMALRATMVAGARSQANIGGVIVGLGETVNGYQLTEVHARHVVLERDGTRKEIKVDEIDESGRD